MVDQQTSNSDVSSAISDKHDTSQFVGFQIANQQYAFPIEQIQEIVILDRVTRTPQVADHVEGVSNLRGAIIPIISLRKLLGLDPLPKDGDTRTIVINVGERTMGCTVDSVSQVIRIPAESIQSVPESMTANGADYISGFAKLDDCLVILLNIDELLDPERVNRNRDSDAPETPPAS
jgi:purine-binding chemotaxis protein CheW